MRRKHHLHWVYISIVGLSAVVPSITGNFWYMVGANVLIILHMIFRDTLNRFQWFPFWGQFSHRLYWIRKDNANPATRHVGVGHVYVDIDDGDIDGEPVSDTMTVNMCVLLLAAGVDTTWSSIGSSLLHFASHPKDRQRLAAGSWT